MVDLVYAVKVYLVQAVGSQRLGALALSIYCYTQRVVVGNVRACVTVAQHRLLLGNHILEYSLVFSRIGEVEVHYLQPCLKVGCYAHTLYTLFFGVDVRNHTQRLATALLFESKEVEVGSTALLDHTAKKL